MLAQVPLDIVSVATPNHTHKPLTLAALEAGCHVLCEKPMALNTAEAREMVDAARAAGKRLMISFNYRFSTPSFAAKQEIEAGTLGDIYYGRTVWLRRSGIPRFGGWFGQKAFSGGGPLIDLGVHRLDLALWLMGHPRPVWVMGSTYNLLGSALAREQNVEFDVEDMAVALIRFENGASLELEASWAANIREKEWMETRLLGSKGGLVQRNIRQGYQFQAEILIQRAGSKLERKLHSSQQTVESTMYHLVDCIANARTHMAPGEEGLVVMEILDAIYQSAETGTPVCLSPQPTLQPSA
jgi:predicted dehydrogenase